MNTIHESEQMTEIQMQNMITRALGKDCNCRIGGTCPQKWHTWNRLSGSGASCFAGKESESFRGRFKLNLPEEDIKIFLTAARRAGFWAERDLDNPTLRVEVSLGTNPSLDKIEVCEAWIRKTKGAVTSDNLMSLFVDPAGK